MVPHDSLLKNSISGGLFKNDETQGARILRNEAHSQYAARRMTRHAKGVKADRVLQQPDEAGQSLGCSGRLLHLFGDDSFLVIFRK